MRARRHALRADRPWYKHDDSTVSQVPAEEVMGFRAQGSVYLLTYVLREE